MSDQPTTRAVSEEQAHTSKEDMSFEEKIGMAKKFDREMKDYAKATVKEFLGIYGYEEDVDINMDESDTQKANETSASTSQATEKQTESSTSTDCHNLHGNRLEKTGHGQVKTVVMIDLDTFDTNEVSEISIANIEGTSRSGNGDSVTNSELASSDEVLKLPCSSERLLSDCTLEVSEGESESELTSLEVLDAISQIIPRSQPVLREHSYATTDVALLPPNADQNLPNSSSNEPTICQCVDMQQSSDIPTKIVESCNATLPNPLVASSLIPNSQSTLLDISNSFEEAVFSSRCQTNLEQNSGGIALSTGSDEMPQTDISTVAIDLNSGIESTQLPPLLTGNTNKIEIIQPNVESCTAIQRTDDISLDTAPLNIGTNPVPPNEATTATLLVSSITQALQKQTNASISESICVKTVPSQHAGSSSLPELDNVRCSEHQRRLLHSSVQLPVALQSPVAASSDCSLQAGRADISSGPSLEDAPDSKEKSSTGKKETRRKREERRRLERERARLRRSQENETEQEERREKDRKRRQLKRVKEKGNGNLLHIALQAQEKASDPVKQRKVAEDFSPEASASKATGFENDSNVSNTTTAVTPEIDSASSDSTKDFDLHRKTYCLNKQMLNEITEPTTSQTMSRLSTLQEDKGISDQERIPTITTILRGQKPSKPEDDLDLSKSANLSSEGATVCGETNFTKQNDSSSKERAGDVKDESRLKEKERSRERMRKRRALESPAQRKARLEEQRERTRKGRAEETNLQRETRRIKDRMRQQVKRTSESEENRSKRLTQQKEATRCRRQVETPQEKQDRQMKDRVRARKSRESKHARQNPE